MDDLINHELIRLEEDYYKCDVFIIKKQIITDIKLLNDALVLINQPIQSF